MVAAHVSTCPLVRLTGALGGAASTPSQAGDWTNPTAVASDGASDAPTLRPTSSVPCPLPPPALTRPPTPSIASAASPHSSHPPAVR